MKKGTLISISGVDGSGKTTQVDMLFAFLKKEHQRVKRIKTFNYFLLRPFLRAVKKKVNLKSSVGIKVNKNPFLKLWFVVAFFDIWLNYILKIRPLKSENTVIVSDRFFLDMAVALVTYGYMPDWIFPYYVRCLPQADVSILLRLNPSLAQKRSQEFDIAYYKKQEEFYKYAIKLLKIKTISAQKNKKKVYNEIISTFQKI